MEFMNKLCKSKIEWVRNPDGSQGYGCNPIKGKCLHSCDYCWAEQMRLRYKQPEKMSWHPEELEKIGLLKTPSTVFVGTTYDIWGDWIDSDYKKDILETIEVFHQHTFLFLTKNPKDYSSINIPLMNCWLGVSETGKEFILDDFYEIIKPNHKFISFEPLLKEIDMEHVPINIDWIIIGALTKNSKVVQPEEGGTKIEWVLPLIKWANKWKVPVFLKNNLLKLYPSLTKRQEIGYFK